MKIWIYSIGLLCGVLFLSLSGQHNLPATVKQTSEMRQYRLAKTYQQLNQHQKAIQILERLYESRPGNIQYFQALLTSYLELQQTEKALQLIQRQKEIDKQNPRYEIDYANLLYKTKRKEEARRVWENLLKKYSRNITIYTLVAHAMANNNLFDEAVEVYKRAAKQFPAKTYLLQNIASLYRSRLQYYKALQYYLAYLKKEPQQYKTVARQILSFKLDAQEVDSLLTLMKSESRKSRNIPELQMLIAQIYQKYQKYDQSLAIYQRLENDQSQGRYLMEFARVAQADSIYQLALDAYQTIIEKYPESPHRLMAYLGAARCHLELARKMNRQDHARQALEIIKEVRSNYSSHPRIADLILLEGQIYRQFFFDIDRAIDTFLNLAASYPKQQRIQGLAYLYAGESYIIRGDLSRASEMFKKVRDSRNRPQALFYLAKIEFYNGNYPGTRDYINQVIKTQGISGELTNDALALDLLLSLENSASEALKKYAEADLLLFQQKKSEAISKLRSSLEKHPPPGFRARLLLKAAQLSVELGEFPEAIGYCNTIIQDSTLHLYADEALFQMATIFHRHLNDFAQAYQLYDRLLVEFPESQFSNRARDRLKEIRKKQTDVMP